jgi:UDP:flavonoid glycosyltransferase YjiC (YdhE family)
VLVGFSTSFQNHAACLQRVIDALADLPVRVLVTLAGAILPDEVQARTNTVVVESAPHDVVMREASLVVTHGGHGTVMTALMHRLPMLVLPHGRDQGDNAVRITERGAGLSLSNTAPTEEMRAALTRLLDEPSFGTSARRLGDAVAAEAEHCSLIDELEALAAQDAPSGTPVRARNEFAYL